MQTPTKNEQQQNSAEYLEKKSFFNRMLTIYGRKAVLEALQNNLNIYRLHLADSNKPAAIVKEIQELAERKNIEILIHDKRSLSRISRNSKQDQGVAADIICPDFKTLDEFLESPCNANTSLIALENITNPQNVGMIIRSACAGAIDGILIPEKGTAQLGPLVIKASTGSLFKAPIIRCEKLAPSLRKLQEAQFQVCTLSSHANTSLFDYKSNAPSVFVLGNESEGVSESSSSISDIALKIPMNNSVESLNVAVSAALVAFHRQLKAS